MTTRYIHKVKRFGVALVILLFGVSCNEDETLDRQGKPTLSLLESTITIAEGEGLNLPIDISYPIAGPSEMRIEIIGGTAAEGEDYIFNIPLLNEEVSGFYGGDGYYASVPAYQTTYVLEDILTPVIDTETEGTETIQLRFFSAVKGYALVDEILTVEITDHVSSSISIELKIDQEITIDGVTSTVCDDMDFDLFLSSSDLFNDDQDHSWDGPCNELLVLDNNPNNLGADYSFYIWVDLWDSSNLPNITNHVDVPMELVLIKTDTETGSEIFNQTMDLTGVFRTDDQDTANGTGGEKLVGKLTVTGNTFTITDTDNTVVVSGRMSG